MAAHTDRPAASRRTRRRWIAVAAAVMTAAGVLGATAPAFASAAPEGVDVSERHGEVDWEAVADAGYRFAAVKATEGTVVANPRFTGQFDGAHAAGLVRGAYHLALPDRSSGAEQAGFFAANGGAWTAGDRTLPGTVDLEPNPNGTICYGLTRAGMVDWITDFVGAYKSRTGSDPIIFTTASWWNQCTGGSGAFAAGSPLWVAHMGSQTPAIPAGFTTHAFWQYDSASIPGTEAETGVSSFNGTQDELLALTDGTG